MAKKSITPEEAIEALARHIREGKVSRPVLLRLIRLGLDEQKRWKAIHHVQQGRVDSRRGAEIAGLGEDDFRDLLHHPHGPRSSGR